MFVYYTIAPSYKWRLLRIELHRLSLRRKRNSIIDSIKINGGSLDRPQIDLNRLENNKCARCGIDLGRIVNRGAPCRLCRFRVCKSCREFTQVRKSSAYSHSIAATADDWICIVCYKRKQMWVPTRTFCAETPALWCTFMLLIFFTFILSVLFFFSVYYKHHFSVVFVFTAFLSYFAIYKAFSTSLLFRRF